MLHKMLMLLILMLFFESFVEIENLKEKLIFKWNFIEEFKKICILGWRCIPIAPEYWLQSWQADPWVMSHGSTHDIWVGVGQSQLVVGPLGQE